METEKLKLLFEKDFDNIFIDLDLFIDSIPLIVKILTVEEFCKIMGFTAPQYYRRKNNTDLWKVSELKKISGIYKQINLGKGGKHV